MKHFVTEELLAQTKLSDLYSLAWSEREYESFQLLDVMSWPRFERTYSRKGSAITTFGLKSESRVKAPLA
jgi:hypothetical protein